MKTSDQVVKRCVFVIPTCTVVAGMLLVLDAKYGKYDFIGTDLLKFELNVRKGKKNVRRRMLFHQIYVYIQVTRDIDYYLLLLNLEYQKKYIYSCVRAYVHKSYYYYR